MKANQIIGINVRWRSPNESEFNKDAQHIYVDIFTSFAEPLRSLSCLVYSFHWLSFVVETILPLNERVKLVDSFFPIDIIHVV